MRRPSRQAFTVVELLVVIGIIAVLMGLLIPAVTIAKNKAKRAKAVSLLQQVEAALSKYYNVNGVYPDGGTADLARAIASVDRDSFGPSVLERDSQQSPIAIKDPYGHVLRYRPAADYEFTDAVTDPKRIDGRNPPRADTYQLWSVGPNGRDEVADGDSEYGDDLVTWK